MFILSETIGESKQPRKKLVIKIYSSRPKKCEGVCELKNKKGYYAEAIWINVKDPSTVKQCDKKKSLKRLKEKKLEVELAMIMDRCKRMQCWVMMKRLMVGKDAWIFKKIDLNKNKSTKNEKITSLSEIESKLKSLKYSKVDEFASDIKIMFSYLLGYPPRSEIHKIVRRINESFELTWKIIQKKWILQEKQERENL